MRYFIFLGITTYIFIQCSFSLAGEYTITCIPSQPNSVIYNTIINDYKYRDISFELEYLNKCNKSKALIIPKDKQKQYSTSGKIASLKIEIAKAEAASYYRNVDNEVAKIAMLSEKVGIAPDIKYLSGLQKRGQNKPATDTQNCSPVDLSSKFGPVRNQDTIGWCYAFAAADMASFKTGFRVSAMDIAVNSTSKEFPHNKRNGLRETDDQITGGYSYIALENMRDKGFCKESDSPSEYFGTDKNFKDALIAIEKKTDDQSLGHYVLNQVLPTAQNSKCVKPDFKDLRDVALTISQSRPQNVIYNINETRCKNKRIKIKLPKLIKNYGKRKEIIDFLDKKLNAQKPLPSIISFDSAFLEEGDTLKPSPHAALIVGRRLNPLTQACEYLIRNSYGKSCFYHPKYNYSCKDGNIWLPRETVQQYIFGATSYEN